MHPSDEVQTGTFRFSSAQRIDPVKYGADCANCPFAKNGKPNEPVGPEGNPSKCKGVLIGEGPGREEADLGRPFVGPTGQQLGEELLQARLRREELFITNATCCRPPQGATDADKRQAAKCCNPVFKATFPKQQKPTLAMGKWAAYALTGKDKGAGNARGFVRDGWLIITWHPTFAFFHAPYEWAAFSIDLDRFARLIRGQLEPEPSRISTNVTAEQMLSMHLLLLNNYNDFIAVDIETAPEEGDREGFTGKDPTRCRLRTIGFGTCDAGMSFEWDTASPALRENTRKLLADPRVRKVFHNGPWFDIRVLKRYGLVVNNWEDTRDLRKALCPTSPLSLRYLTSLCTDFTPWKEGDSDDEKGLVFTDDYEKLKRYNALDCVATARVYRRLIADLASEPGAERLYEIHKELSVTAAEMHTTGFLVDKRERARLAAVLQKLADRAEKRLLKLVGIQGFTCTPNNMRALLFRRHETEKVKRFSLPDPMAKECWTDSGLISVDEGSLLQILIDPYCPADLKAIVEQYWKLTGFKKARSTFVTSKLIDEAIGRDGRARPGWNSAGPDTGRWSCGSPNLQNLEQSMRRMYRAEPGKILVHPDYSQLELRVMAAVAQDDVLAAALLSGDVYTEDAKFIFNLPSHMTKCDCKGTCKFPETHVKGKARKRAKIGHLGFQYGAGTRALFIQALPQDRGITYKQIEIIHEGLKRRYNRTVAYWYEEQERVRKCGYSESRILGRKRSYPRDPPITEVANYPIQSTASDVANLGMLSIRSHFRKIPGAAILTQEHDAFTAECYEKDAEEVAKIMKDCMEQPHIIDGKQYIFTTEIKIGTHWHKL